MTIYSVEIYFGINLTQVQILKFAISNLDSLNSDFKTKYTKFLETVYIHLESVKGESFTQYCTESDDNELEILAETYSRFLYDLCDIGISNLTFCRYPHDTQTPDEVIFGLNVYTVSIEESDENDLSDFLTTGINLQSQLENVKSELQKLGFNQKIQMYNIPNDCQCCS
jgi:hypothetical protein